MNKQAKIQTLKRLSIAEGHLKKVRDMVEKEEYCLDVIHQSKAVQAALKRVDEIVLHGHLHTCVLGEMKGDTKKKNQLAEEIVDLFKRNNG